MTVTTSYSLGVPTSFALIDGGFSNNLSQLDLTSLSNGGVAFAAFHYGHTDVGVGGGGAAQDVSLRDGYYGAIDQLKSGDLAVVTQYNGDITWALYDSSGYGTGDSGSLGLSQVTNPDVVGLTGGRFVIGYQRNFGGSDNDIQIDIRSPHGDSITHFAVSGSSDNDENVSLAALHDGGFAVTWDRNTGGDTAAWFAIYNSDGSVRVAPQVSDSATHDNTAMSAVGLAKGGFAVAYVDDGWTGTDQITVAIYKANGDFVAWTNVSTGVTGAASEPSLTVLQDGTLAVSWTREFSPTDHDIYMQLIDPKTGGLLLSAPEVVTISGDDEFGSSITALGEGQVLVGWDNFSTGAQAASLQLFVERDGDAAKNHIIGSGAYDTINGFASGDVLKGGAGNDTIDGGDGKDVINGQAGADYLTGGTGKDLFQFTAIIDVQDGDTITDLEAKDRINLAGIDADSTTAGDQSFTIVSSFTGAAGQMTIDYNVTHAGMTTLQMDVDGDGAADGSIMIAGDRTSFTNFVL